MAKYQSGIAGIWLEEHQILEAAHKCRSAGFKKFDTITPYPVHGMEEAMEIKRSNIPYVTFIAGLIGAGSGLLLTWWTSAVNWPINVGGKPPFSLPAFIPVIFEVTILFAALSSVGALFYYCGLPKVDPPLIDLDLTSHKFALFVPEDDTGFNAANIEKMFKEMGATEVKRAEF